MFRSDANPAFLPEEIGNLVVQPVERESVAAQAGTVVPTASSTFRVPVVAADPTASWTAEGAEIDVSSATLDEVVVTPPKVAGLTIISAELADDSDPAASQIVGDGLARDIARQVDAAFFGSSDDDEQPSGLEDLAGVNTVDAGGEWANIDPFTLAIFSAENVGATLTSWVASPDDAVQLAQLKEEEGSNKPLLQPDPTMPTRRMIGGVPMLVSPAVTPGVVWGIPADRALVVRRTDTTLDVDRSAYFSSHRVGIRATMRVGFAFPHPAAIQRVALDMNS
ncbi:phage major capsid protein [Saccharomonospora sp. CUA-673]|uniref:phage major capsid protein n=1 Tax=Saccharomonospora sp. CUA-673 TaxID=1904969 RepID=UPI0009F9899F|nr:phage major capsid protein [Saccharomonospora sp. CUA-673]